MSIKGDIKELEDIEIEIKRINTQLNALRNKRNILKSNINQYLQAKDQPGVKYGNIAIIREEKEKFTSKGIKKKDKQDKAISILKQYGINNPKDVFNEIQNSLKGEKIVDSVIKVKKIN